MLTPVGTDLRMSSRTLAAACLSLSLLPRLAAGDQTIDDGERCKALVSADFSGVLDAPTRVVEAALTKSSGPSGDYCEVTGYVAPSVGFKLRLPVGRWNGKLIELGCGGFCGSTSHISACDGPIHKGYACIVSDGGHQGGRDEALWAWNNWRGKVDLLFRAAHVSALAGKAVAARFYDQKPTRSYYMGCSGGGYSGMWEAQHFPWDFDGIVAGAPSISETGVDMGLLWGNRVLTNAVGDSVLTEQDIALLHQAVLNRCDLNDGIRDGVIGDPRRCEFKPAELRCRAGKNSDCLTDVQIEAAERIYSGPVTSKGERIFGSIALRGSELIWLQLFGAPSINYIQDVFRYFDFEPAPGPTWKPADFDFDQDYKRLGMMESLEPVNPDLRRFKEVGGKLILYTGWSDAVEAPLRTVDYYETVERVMGGREHTQDFLRLFVIPGMNHCRGGDGADVVDYLSYLEAWVEQGKPPDVMIGAHIDDSYLTSHPTLARYPEFPLAPSVPVKFTRPVYPYPLRAEYKGTGDPKEAKSFAPAEP